MTVVVGPGCVNTPVSLSLISGAAKWKLGKNRSRFYSKAINRSLVVIYEQETATDKINNSVKDASKARR